MIDYTPEPTYQYLDQLIDTKTPVVPLLSLVKIKKNGTTTKELSIIYYNPKEHALNRIYDNDFASFISDTLSSFERGMSTQILAGIVRSSKPSVIEPWSGDTIEKTNYEPFSLYRGLLSIVGNNDGLPLIVPEYSGIIGNIIPAVKQILDGKNPTIVRRKIKQLEALQYRIVDIVGDNPIKTAPVIADTIDLALNDNFQGLSDKQIARLEKLNTL